MPFSGWDTYLLLGCLGGAILCPTVGIALAMQTGNPWWMLMSTPLVGMFWVR